MHRLRPDNGPEFVSHASLGRAAAMRRLRRFLGTRGAARSGVTKAKPSAVAPSLENIAESIDSGGQIIIGRLAPIECAAVANDEHNCLAMLQRRPGETLQRCSSAWMRQSSLP